MFVPCIMSVPCGTTQSGATEGRVVMSVRCIIICTLQNNTVRCDGGARGNVCTLYNVCTLQNNTVRCGGGGGNGNSSWRMAQARGMHRTICTLLLAANTALTAHLETIMALLPPWATRDAAAAAGERCNVCFQHCALDVLST